MDKSFLAQSRLVINVLPFIADEKIFALKGGTAIIKIEPNFIFRGTIHPVSEIEVKPKVSEILERTVKMQVISFEDLYAGKICATLNRQHPRDLFDMKLLLENEGLSDEVRYVIR